MDQVVAAGSRWRIMKNRWSVYLYEFIGKKHVEPDLKKKKKNSVSVSKLNKNIIKNG